MQVNLNDKQNFGAMYPYDSLARSVLYSRLTNPRRTGQYVGLEMSQMNNPVDIILFKHADGTNRLSARIKGENIDEYHEESKFRAALNLSPIKFLEKMCNIIKSR